jgi:hypothetical protein
VATWALGRLLTCAAAALALAACRPAPTQVYVRVSAGAGLRIAEDVDSVILEVSDLSSTGRPLFTSPDRPLCHRGLTTGCEPLPLDITLVPGPHAPQDRCEIAVQALKGGQVVIADASVFRFTPGESERIDFVLYPSCLGTTCASEGLSCGAFGACELLVP